MTVDGTSARRTYGAARVLTVLAAGVAAAGFWAGVAGAPLPSQAQPAADQQPAVAPPMNMNRSHGSGAAGGDPSMQHGDAGGHGDMAQGPSARTRLRTRGS